MRLKELDPRKYTGLIHARVQCNCKESGGLKHFEGHLRSGKFVCDGCEKAIRKGYGCVVCDTDFCEDCFQTRLVKHGLAAAIAMFMHDVKNKVAEDFDQNELAAAIAMSMQDVKNEV